MVASRISVVAGTALSTALCLAAAGCGGQPNESATAPPTVSSPASAPTTATAGVKDVTIRVSDGRVEPPPGRVDVRQGQLVRLRVSSDRADEVHVHLYDLKRHVPAGGTTTIEFRADIAGLAEVELEETDKQLVQLVIV